MPEILEAYDKAIHEAPEPSVQMAQRLLARVRQELKAGRLSREQAQASLEALYDHYAELGCVDEREAVADVLDLFSGHGPAGIVV